MSTATLQRRMHAFSTDSDADPTCVSRATSAVDATADAKLLCGERASRSPYCEAPAIDTRVHSPSTSTPSQPRAAHAVVHRPPVAAHPLLAAFEALSAAVLAQPWACAVFLDGPLSRDTDILVLATDTAAAHAMLTAWVAAAVPPCPARRVAVCPVAARPRVERCGNIKTRCTITDPAAAAAPPVINVAHCGFIATRAGHGRTSRPPPATGITPDHGHIAHTVTPPGSQQDHHTPDRHATHNHGHHTTSHHATYGEPDHGHSGDAPHRVSRASRHAPGVDETFALLTAGHAYIDDATELVEQRGTPYRTWMDRDQVADTVTSVCVAPHADYARVDVAPAVGRAIRTLRGWAPCGVMGHDAFMAFRGDCDVRRLTFHRGVVAALPAARDEGRHGTAGAANAAVEQFVHGTSGAAGVDEGGDGRGRAGTDTGGVPPVEVDELRLSDPRFDGVLLFGAVCTNFAHVPRLGHRIAVWSTRWPGLGKGDSGSPLMARLPGGAELAGLYEANLRLCMCPPNPCLESCHSPVIRLFTPAWTVFGLEDDLPRAGHYSLD